MNELISIITPSYNSEKYLKECIESVLNQTYSNWEMLIVDDASIDGSRFIIENYSSKESRIKAILLDENIGAAEARNIAIDRSEGRYIAFLDSDDVWFPEKLDIQLMFMRDYKCSFTFSSYEVITEDGLKVTSRISVPIKISYSQYLKNTIIGCLTVMIDKSKFDKKISSNLNFKTILYIGLFQILALIPGVSRAGITITAARLFRFNRFDSSKISFLLAIPAIAGASVLQLKNAIGQSFEFNYLILISITLSFLFSYFTIKFFLDYINAQNNLFYNMLSQSNL